MQKMSLISDWKQIITTIVNNSNKANKQNK